MTVLTGERATTTNVLDHETRLRSALATASVAAAPSEHFNPGFELPANSAALRAFFAAADIRFADLGEVGACRLALMDLMGNPGTRTVKTFASLVIVARAVRYIQATGERIMILTPSSANKATALRDAVQRAYRAGLATPHQLQITTVVPAGSRGKLWSSDLATDRELMARNPMCIFGGTDAAAVKQLALAARNRCVAELKDRFGVNLWHTLDLANYRCADSVRAFAEQAAVPPDPEVTRVHAHAVSSAFGLLGHHFGGGRSRRFSPGPSCCRWARVPGSPAGRCSSSGSSGCRHPSSGSALPPSASSPSSPGVMLAAQRAVPGVRIAVISGLTTDKDRLIGISTNRVASQSGIVVGSVIGGVVLAFDDRPAFLTMVLFYGAMLLLFAVLTAIRVPHVESLADRKVKPRVLALRDRPFLTLAMLDGLLALCWGMLDSGVPLWITHHTRAHLWIISVLMGCPPWSPCCSRTG